MNQFHIKDNFFNDVAVGDFNGGISVRDFNGSAVFGFNGGAVALDSQGCEPLVRIPTTNRESRSDGIGPFVPSDVAMDHGANPITTPTNTTAPPFPMRRDTVTRGLHPWLSNIIAPRFETIALRITKRTLLGPMFASNGSAVLDLMAEPFHWTARGANPWMAKHEYKIKPKRTIL